MTDLNKIYFAKSISNIIHPLILSPLTFALLFAEMRQKTPFSYIYLFIVVMTISIIPLLYVLKMKNDGEIENIDIPDRKQRQKPFVKGTILFLITSFLLVILRAPSQFVTIMLIYTINTGLATLITKYWKISVHGLSFGIPIATFGMLLSKRYFYLSSLLPLLVYSRVKLKAHSISQVVAGFSLGFILTILQIKILWPDLV
jgi:membrane-associated phospholipid phosphatase